MGVSVIYPVAGKHQSPTHQKYFFLSDSDNYKCAAHHQRIESGTVKISVVTIGLMSHDYHGCQAL